MPYTNPGSISNSGAKQFTNQSGSIYKLNYNRIIASENYYIPINNKKNQYKPYVFDINNLFVINCKKNKKHKKHKK